MRVIYTRKQEKKSSKKDTKEKNLTGEEREKSELLTFKAISNTELVIVCSRTLTNYVTEEEEGVVKRNKVRCTFHLSFMININLFSIANIIELYFRICFRIKFIMASKPKKVTYNDPVDDNADYLEPLNLNPTQQYLTERKHLKNHLLQVVSLVQYFFRFHSFSMLVYRFHNL